MITRHAAAFSFPRRPIAHQTSLVTEHSSMFIHHPSTSASSNDRRQRRRGSTSVLCHHARVADRLQAVRSATHDERLQDDCSVSAKNIYIRECVSEEAGKQHEQALCNKPPASLSPTSDRQQLRNELPMGQPKEQLSPGAASSEQSQSGSGKWAEKGNELTQQGSQQGCRAR